MTAAFADTYEIADEPLLIGVVPLSTDSRTGIYPPGLLPLLESHARFPIEKVALQQ